LARLAFVANFISEPALKGCIVGLALTIIAGQVPKLLGVSKIEGMFPAKGVPPEGQASSRYDGGYFVTV
jgi:MFS superfamily sulfate permease-like transporter